MDVILSDGGPCSVRPLGLYELDAVPLSLREPYKISLLVAGGIIEERDYDFSAPAPKRPDKPEHLCPAGTIEHDEWIIWNRHLAALSVERERIEALERFAHDAARYVLEKCLDEADRPRVRTPEDLDKILLAALLHKEISLKDIETVLERTFPGLLQWAAHLVRLAEIAGRQMRGSLDPAVGRTGDGEPGLEPGAVAAAVA